MGIIKIPDNSIQFFTKHYKGIFESGNLAEGEWIEKVAEWIRNYTGAPFAHPVNSNGSGLLSILSVLKHYYNKKKIFIQSNTMYGVKTISITSGLELCGYVECDLTCLMPTYDQVEKFINSLKRPSECVFLLTHIGGIVNPDIERISNLCKSKSIFLVEDCAHSLGSTFKSKHTGLFGDAGVYSLYSTKAIPAGEGGVIITKNKNLYEKVHKFSMYDRFDQSLDLGINNRMSELNALFAYSVLLETEKIIETKYKIANLYKSVCEQYDWHFLDPSDNFQRSNLYKFILVNKNSCPTKYFERITIKTSSVYDYALGADPQEITKRHICLPIWYKLEEKNISSVVSQLTR